MDHIDAEEIYADITACLLALCNALDSKGVLSKAELAEAFQERWLSIRPSGKPDGFELLHHLAVALKSSPPR